MILEEKKIVLKNGVTALLKTPEISDAEKLLDCIKTICGETNFLARYKEDWETTTAEDEAKWIQNNRDSENNLIIACYIDGEIIGNCDISFQTGSKTFHRAVIGIAIREKYWGLGIGSAMFKELIAAAEKQEKTEIVELEYMQGNDRGKALYEKFGFREVCITPKACKLRDGSYLNLVYMQKYL